MSTLSLHIPLSLAIRHRRCRPANEVAANESSAAPLTAGDEAGAPAQPAQAAQPQEARRFQRRLHVPIGLGWLGELDISFSVGLNAGSQCDEAAATRPIFTAASTAASPAAASVDKATPAPAAASTPPAGDPPIALGSA